MQITLQPAEIVNLDKVEIEAVRDLFREQKIIAKVINLPRPIVLWSGSTEYQSASAWNNQTATARASAVLALSSVPWAF
jgi:hypothetical protein